MGLDGQEYKRRQTDNLRKMVLKQDREAKSRLSETSFGWDTPWENKKSRIYQARPTYDKKKEATRKLKETADAGKIDPDHYLNGDMNRVIGSNEVRQSVAVREPVREASVLRAEVSRKAGSTDVRMPYDDNKVQESVVQDTAVIESFMGDPVSDSVFPEADDLCFFDKFISVSSYDDYVRDVKGAMNGSEITGVYLIANVTKKKMYVGCGIKAVERCGQHLRRRIGSVDPVPMIREDMLTGDELCVNFIKLKDTDFDTVEDMQSYYIRKYDSRDPNGYNDSIILA